MEYVAHIYNDARIHSFVCFACGQIKVDTGGCRSDIQYSSAAHLFALPENTLQHNFSYNIFRDKYCKPGTPLSFTGSSSQTAAAPDFTDWRATIRLRSELAEKKYPHLAQIAPEGFLCCPEDQRCPSGCEKGKLRSLCENCEIPICTECIKALKERTIIPEGLCNDNWHGYIQSWIYEQKVTWMEKTVCSPYWTGLTVFTIGEVEGKRQRRKRHLLHDALYDQKVRVAFKGQLFSAPLDWWNIRKQLEDVSKQEKVVLPVYGAVLAAQVCLCITAGLVDLNKVLKEATVRVDIVVRLISMLKDSGHPDYKRVEMREVERLAWNLVPRNTSGQEATVPVGVLDVMEDTGADSSESDESESGEETKMMVPLTRQLRLQSELSTLHSWSGIARE